MKKSVNIATHGDILSYAESIGYDWNEAFDILRDDRVLPDGESSQSAFNFKECISPKYSLDFTNDSIKILVGFMVSENVSEFMLVEDN